MFKKGMITLVCLTVLSALWAWGATTYAVKTQLTNTGGTITVRTGIPQVSGIKYTNFTTQAQIPVTVTPDATHKISAITVNGSTTNYASQTDPVTVNVQKAGATSTATQSVVVTFAVRSAGQVATKTWQLQTKNYNYGGNIVINRGSDATVTQTGYGKLVLKNYADTTPVTVNVVPLVGYAVDKVTLNGTALAAPFVPVTVTPTTSTSVNTVIVTYKKVGLTVTTHTVPFAGQANTAPGQVVPEFQPNGIAPVNPSTTYGGTVRLVVTPTGANNLVTAVNVSGTDAQRSVKLTDRFGVPVTLPAKGAVKVVISNIQTSISVTTGYGRDNTAEMQNCTSTCHLAKNPDNSYIYPTVVNANSDWDASAHKSNAVDCVTCHQTMPGPDLSVQATKETLCAQCHSASVAKVQASVHYTKPSGAMACADCHAATHNPVGNADACSSCHATVNNHTAENMNGKGCIDCHDKHNPKTVAGVLGTPSAHPAVTLYTFEELGYQMNGGQAVPVQVDANGKGMPYSPKMTCGTAGCHVKNGIDYTYDKISDHAFHSNEGRSEYTDTANGKFDATKNKPWTQSTAMVGKW